VSADPQGTTIIADNVVKPGNPAYLSYVRATPEQKRKSLASPRLTKQPPTTPNPTSDDAWNTAFRDGPLEETRWAPDEADGETADGDPSFIYTSEMLDGWDPYTGEKDACEVSVCTGRE
jgi:catechol O-methyltransferase